MEKIRNLPKRDTEVTEFAFEPRQSGSRAALSAGTLGTASYPVGLINITTEYANRMS